MTGSRRPLQSTLRGPGRSAAGFTIIEAVLSVVIVATLTTTMLTSVSANRAAMKTMNDRAQGLMLAEALVAEIVALPFNDPSGSVIDPIGPNSGEAGATRAAFDDCDDYHGFSEPNCLDKSGVAIAAGSGYARSVTVEFVQAAALNTAAGSGSRVKRITVTVSSGSKPVASLVAVRTSASLDPVVGQSDSLDTD